MTSQFEQHLRAVLDLPLGSTDMLAETTVMANVLGGPDDPDMPMPQRMAEVWRRFPDAKIHLYGKTWRPGRKIGHVNVSGNHPAASAALRRRAQLRRPISWSMPCGLTDTCLNFTKECCYEPACWPDHGVRFRLAHR